MYFINFQLFNQKKHKNQRHLPSIAFYHHSIILPKFASNFSSSFKGWGEMAKQ